MKFLLPFVTVASLLFVNNVEARWKPVPGMTWNYVLGAKVDITIEKAQVLDVDYQTDPKLIQQYHNYGKRVVCYFSGGTIEKSRDDYKYYTAVDGLVRNTYGDWPDEKWLDFRKEGIKPLIINRMKKAISSKCDAIEVDNLDGYQISDVKDNWSKPLTKEDTIKFAQWLGNTAHSLGISIGLKNIPGLISSVGPYFDFAINESCIRYKNECAMYRNFIKSGKPVFGITYGSFSGQLDTMCRELNGVGMSMIVKKNQSLTQASTIFDGKTHCGSYFNYGYSTSSSSSGKTIKKVTSRKATTKKASKKVVSTKKSSKTKKVIVVIKKVKKVKN